MAARRKKTAWVLPAATGIAATLVLFLLSGQALFNITAPKTFSQASKDTAGVNVAALEEALMADEAEARHKAQAITITSASAYSTPESYLFSQEADMLPDDMMEEEEDVSAIVLNTSP